MSSRSNRTAAGSPLDTSEGMVSGLARPPRSPGEVERNYTGRSIDGLCGLKNFGPDSVMWRQSSWRMPNSP